MNNPIIEEVCKARETLTGKLEFDLHLICKDVTKRPPATVSVDHLKRPTKISGPAQMTSPFHHSRMSSSLIVSAAAFLLATFLCDAQETSSARRWDFNTPREMLTSSQIAGVEIKDGELTGKTEFDPHFSLALPAAGLDARRFATMRMRMFSSSAADAIGIYYKDQGDLWALGAGPRIEAGWHVYEFDLNTQVGWNFGDAGRDEARLWGGPNQRVHQLRIDPGNQAGREVKIDWIEIDLAHDAAPEATPQVVMTAPESPVIETVLPKGATWRWDNEGDLGGWKSDNFETVEARGGLLRGLTKYDAMLVAPPVKFEARTYSIVEFKMKSDLSGTGEIFFARSGETSSAERSIGTSIVGDGKWHVYRYDMADSAQWSGVIEGLRFDPLNPAGAHIEVEYLRLLPPNDDNLIANGGFEITDLKNAGQPESWRVSKGQLTLSPQPDGGHSLLLSADAAKEATISTGNFENISVGRHQFSLQYQSETAARARVLVNFQSIYGEKLSPFTFEFPIKSAPHWQNVLQVITIPERAARLELVLEVRDSAKVQVDNLALKTLEPPSLLVEAGTDSEPVWQATWITAADTAGQDNAPRQFRKTITIADPAAVESARVLVTADEGARLWVNGRQLPGGPFHDDWKIPDVYDIAPFLKKGENVVAVQSWSAGGPEGIMAEIGIRFQDGKDLFLLSDASWKGKTGEVATNWASPEFSDAAWSAPQLIAPFPGGPWGTTVPYTYLGPSLLLDEVSFSFAASGVPGETQSLTATFTPTQIPRQTSSHPVVLSLELARPGERGVSFRTEPLDTQNWRVGTPVTIGPLPVELPRYSMPGEYQFHLRVPYATLRPAASFQPTAQAGTDPGSPDTLTQGFLLKTKSTIKTPVAKIKYRGEGQVPFLEINGQPHPVMHMMHSNAEKKLIRLTRENGVNLIWLNFAEGFGWKKGGPYDFTEIEQKCSRFLNQYPEAYLVLNVPLDTVYNPGMRDWNKQNPEELVKDDSGSTDIGGYHGSVITAPSYSSREWMKASSDAWRALIRHLRSGPMGERIIGFVPISGISWEWFYWGAQSREFVDYSRPATQHFQRWAKEKYGDITKTNAIWKTNYANFEAITIPTREERLHRDAGIFLDPQKSARLIDFREFFSGVVSGDVLEFCRIVKEETGGEALTGTYYGYNMQVISSYLAQNTGHMALHQALQSPGVDFFMSPSRYTDRGIGGGAGFMMTTDSIKLHGKYYIAQADIRTVNATGPGGQLARLSTLADSAAVLEREFANSITNGVASQWYDFGEGWIGGDARLMEVVGKLQKIEADLIKVPRKTLDPARHFAVIVDERSTFYTALESNIHSNTVSEQINSLHRTGVGFDTFLLDDLEKLGDYKAFLFLNTFRLTPAQQKFIDEKLKVNGKVLTWVYAPGVIDEATLDFSRVEKITGFQIGVKNEAAPLRVKMTSSQNPVRRYISGNAIYGTPEASAPILYARDGESLGLLDGTQLSGLAFKKNADWTSIFSLAPNLPPTLLRGIAATAGLPVYNEFEGDITYVSDRLLAVHTYGGGVRSFTVTAQKGVVKELLHGKEAIIQNGKFSFDLPEKSTSLFLLPEGN